MTFSEFVTTCTLIVLGVMAAKGSFKLHDDRSAISNGSAFEQVKRLHP